jgi:hypothetical protein
MTEYFLHTPDGEPPVRIDVNLSLDEDEAFMRPVLLWVFVKLAAPDADGLATSEEMPTLTAIREALSAAFEKELKTVFSGSRISDGWFELYFYARNGKGLIQTAGEVMEGFPGYSFDTGSSRDEKWTHYHETLYPETEMLHQIQSRHIIEELRGAGDRLERERDVEHYLFFQVPGQRDRAMQRLEASGCRAGGLIEQEGEYACGAVAVCAHAVDEERVAEWVRLMLEVVAEEHGYYEGWSTTLADEVDGQEGE